MNLLSLAGLLAMGQPMPDYEITLASFSAAPTRAAASTHVRVGLLSSDRTDLWFERRMVRRRGDPEILQWVVARNCPGAFSTFDERRRILMPSANPVRNDPDTVIGVADGTQYILEMAAYYLPDGQIGQVRMQTNVGTSVAAWVDAMLRTLEPCWTETRPHPR